MQRALEAAFPSRMGRDYRWLVGSQWISNLGDGVSLAAGPLLVASQTRNPQLIALATALQWIPFLAFGLYAGVLADRVDRKRLIVVANLARGAVVAALAATVAFDAVSVWVVLVALFLAGVAEAFVDSTSNTLLPMVVDHADIGTGNSRLIFGQITINRLVGPPLGALLFTVGAAWPFAASTLLFVFGSVLTLRIATSMVPTDDAVDGIDPDAPGVRFRVRTDIVEGVRWLWNHPPVRTLTIMAVSFNVTFGAAWSILVLYALERLGLGAVGFGLLTTVGALGGLLGAGIYGRLERRFSIGQIMRAGLLIETFTHLGLALSTSPWTAMPIFFAFGMHEAIWGTVATSVRQRAVPTRFQGRVGAVYMTGGYGGLVVGAAIGGVIARVWGVTGPFWFGLVGSVLILVWIWRRLELIAHTTA
ncbi:MFS transporter [Ilumatobacter coccineus]|uniref:Putative major facilitator superfamily transporter n=1 Tax=Ilumatobacter coccineus (strain NBRC 103263 / KCTC 29153 / YM16-304) TaxID=1313172 RepID=A0A6C7E5W9_ILUCY|nr:MFS transporter [Ilumatobacter coccineus]BAN01900.1 putative major facilitator superfamily transporter [Ilumatobacter coccineus YM16-304]